MTGWQHALLGEAVRRSEQLQTCRSEFRLALQVAAVAGVPRQALADACGMSRTTLWRWITTP